MKLWNSQLYCWNSLNDESTTDVMDDSINSIEIMRTALFFKNLCTISICLPIAYCFQFFKFKKIISIFMAGLINISSI